MLARKEAGWKRNRAAKRRWRQYWQRLSGVPCIQIPKLSGIGKGDVVDRRNSCGLADLEEVEVALALLKRIAVVQTDWQRHCK